MSYEGYTQYLCAKGHIQTRDCMEPTLKVCPSCGSRIAWSNGVDQTNGSRHQFDLPDEVWETFPETASQEEWDALLYCKGCEHCDNGRIDGYVELEKTSDAIPCTCRSCGHQHNIEPARYKIPTTKGRRL